MFDSVFESATEHDYNVVVYGADEATAIAEWFTTHGVDVDERPLPTPGPPPFVVIRSNGDFVGAVGVAELTALTEPPVVRPGGGVSEGYRALFELLDRALFTSMERRHLLAVSREIEDRAYRVGRGRLAVGFQTPSAFEAQSDHYRHLAADTDLDIHIYGSADWTPPTIAGIVAHDTPAELGRYWLLAFDGGDDEANSCGLLAEERPDGYHGFWTDDPETVSRILTALPGL